MLKSMIIVVMLAITSLAVAQDLRELTQSRTAFAKKYLNTTTGAITANLYNNPIHYLDSDGKFKDIITTLESSNRPGYFAEVVKGPYKAFFKQNPADSAAVLVQHRSGFTMSMRLNRIGFYDASTHRQQSFGLGSSISIQANDNQITYEDVLPGMNIRFYYLPGKLKEEIILSEQARQNIPDPAVYGMNADSTYLAFLIQLDVDRNLDAYVRDSVKISLANYKGRQRIRFRDQLRKVRFTLPLDFAYLKTSGPDSLHTDQYRIHLERRFIQRNGKNYVVAGVPYTWLTNLPPGDVIIDPSINVVSGPDADARIENGSNYGSDYRLMVGKQTGYPKKRTLVKFPVELIPENATILDATLNMYYNGISCCAANFIDRDVHVNVVFKPWSESTVTRDYPWTVPYGSFGDYELGHDFEGTSLDNELFTDQRQIWKVFDVKSAVERWTSNQLVNNGMVLWATNEDTDGTDVRMRSKEYSDPNLHPYLSVTYLKPLRSLYYLKDHLGSIRLTVDETGSVVGYDDYRPFGKQLAGRSGNQGNPDDVHKFTGKELDAETGLYYFGARYYDPETGRWLAIDPLAAEAPEVSPYHYTHNNPLNRVDPDGRQDPYTRFAYVFNSALDHDHPRARRYVESGDLGRDIENVVVNAPKVLDPVSSGLAYASGGAVFVFPPAAGPLAAASIGVKAVSTGVKLTTTGPSQDILGDVVGGVAGYANPIAGEFADLAIDNFKTTDAKVNPVYNIHSGPANNVLLEEVNAQGTNNSDTGDQLPPTPQILPSHEELDLLNLIQPRSSH